MSNDDDEPDITITTEIEFGDADPEDAYDAEDSEDERLDVLEAAVEHIREHRDERFEARRQEVLRVITEMLDARRRNRDRAEAILEALEAMG